MTTTLASTLIFYLMLGACALIFIIWGFLWMQSTKKQRELERVKKAISSYFLKSGVSVSVQCASSEGRKFIAFIESEPMKRFRLSHIVEITLRDYVHNLHGLELEKVYWRFPINNKQLESADADGKSTENDEYLTEGFTHYRHLPKVEVMETSWESFREASTDQPIPKDLPQAADPFVKK